MRARSQSDHVRRGAKLHRSRGRHVYCTNSNPDEFGSPVVAFHTNDYCPAPDLDHGWASSHKEGNYSAPNNMLKSSPNDGFVRVNDLTEQPDNGVESATEDESMGFYNESDLPFYY